MTDVTDYFKIFTVHDSQVNKMGEIYFPLRLSNKFTEQI